MRSSTFLSLVSAFAALRVQAQSDTVPVTGILGNATAVDNNPIGPVYVATLPEKEFFNPEDPRGNVKGSVSATAAPGGKGVTFTVKFSNLPTSGGPFLYHIHVAPVNFTGSCASTLAHLDPFIRGEKPPCDASLPETCQVGDLSGKYGKITSDPFEATYTDPFASTLPGIGAFFGNRSITVHFANTTRITCASFEAVAGTVPSNSTSPSATITSPPLASFTGGVSGLAASLMSVAGAAAVAVMML